jgi:FkbM family methyltransferase
MTASLSQAAGEVQQRADANSKAKKNLYICSHYYAKFQANKMNYIKGLIFRHTKIENYLAFLQWAYFFAYQTGLLRFDSNYDCHYFVKKLISKGDTILDLGANLGYYSILFARWTGRTGKVFSVEPIALYNRIFQRKAKKYNTICLYSYALGNEEKSVELVSSPGAGFLRTGLPHVYDPQKDGNIDEQEFKFTAQMRIPAQLFASLDRIDYIKCDVEGFEYTILANMKDILRRCRPKVQVEVWPENEKSILRLFAELDYLPYKLHNKQLVLQQGSASSLPGDYFFLPQAR